MRTITLLSIAALATIAATSALAQPPAGRGGRGQTPEQRQAAFTAADANKDGKLDKAEFAASLPEQVRGNADQIFSGRDANTDGAISQEEYLAPGRGRGGGGGRPEGAPPPQ